MSVKQLLTELFIYSFVLCANTVRDQCLSQTNYCSARLVSMVLSHCVYSETPFHFQEKAYEVELATVRFGKLLHTANRNIFDTVNEFSGPRLTDCH